MRIRATISRKDPPAVRPNQAEAPTEKGEDPVEDLKVEMLETRIQHLERQSESQRKTIQTLIRILNNLDTDESTRAQINAVKREIRHQSMKEA